MKTFSSSVEEIKNRLDIVEFVGSYVKLQKAGVNWRALCPFHAEKGPSFFVSPSRQIWHCFGGCGEGGDVFKFVMKIEGVEFGDALRLLAQRAGVQLKRQDPKLRSERQRLYEICELAARFFEKQLAGSEPGKAAKDYLLARGIVEESIKKWRLGWSPEAWQGLSDFLVGRGYKREEIEKAGLAVRNEQGSFYDRFRSRIMFPVLDVNAQIIGFGGRVFGKSDTAGAAKYVNIPNTLLYDKSRVLYGLHAAKMEVRKRQECILVEGYTDAILVAQAGFPQVVSVSGTALTPYQLNLLKRYSDNLTTAFDMDLAGNSATKRGIDLAQSLGFNIKVLLLPEGLDPADVASKNPELLAQLLKEARSILDFYFDTTFSRFNTSSGEGKKNASKILLPVIKRLTNTIERSFWVQQLAKRLEVREEDVFEELKKVKPAQETALEAPPAAAGGAPPKTRRELLEERVLVLTLKFPQYMSLANQDLKNKLVDNELYVNYLSLLGETEEFLDASEALFEIQFCLKELQSMDIKTQLGQISQDIKKAETEKNFQKVEELLQNFNQLTRQINQLI